MADNIDTIDRVDKYVTGTITLQLENRFALEAETSNDWLPDTYDFETDPGKKLTLDSTNYDLGLILVGKVPSTSTDPERLYHTYTETKPDSEQDGWLSSSDPYFENRGITPPSAAVLGYTIDKTIDLKANWPEDQEELDSTTITLYADGTEVLDIESSDSKYIIVDLEGLWWVTTTYDDLPLDLYARESVQYTINVTRTSSEADTLDDVDIVSPDLINPVTEVGGGEGVGGLDLDVLNYGSDECHAVPRTLSFFAQQSAKVSLYPTDRNGDIVTLGSETYNVTLVLQAARASGSLDTVFEATRVGDTDEFTVDFKHDDPGMYVANLMVHKDDEDNTLLYVTRYYVSVEPSGDYGGVVTIPEIRFHLSDTCAQENVLLDAFEYSDSDIINAIHACIEYYNGFLGGRGQKFSASNFPVSGRYFLKQGVAAFLLRTKAISLARNTLPINAGGVSVDDQNKAKIYMELASVFQEGWIMWCGRSQHEYTFRRGFMVQN